jgi:hypothetical protein
VNQKLVCPLSKAELAALETDMAEVLCVLTACMAKRDLLDKQIVSLHDRARELTAKRRAGAEIRDVPVTEKPCWRRKVVVLRRADTQEKIGERPLTLDDRQMLLVPNAADKTSVVPTSVRALQRASARARVRRVAAGK